MKSFLCLLGLFLVGHWLPGWAQEPADAAKASFVPPFDFPMTFSGNFGEIRANHFHGGLDFKTGGTIGKPVRALVDGYLSRIRVTHGSGYVLDVAYENGYSTINRHLSAFVGEVARRVEDLQYEQESWEVEIIPSPGEYPVKAGQVIALSGNTGYSFGPHLHLDVFETETGDFIDPLPFFADKVKDHTAPRAEGIMLFPQAGQGVVEGKPTRQTFPARPARPINAWGLIGVGIKAYDYMDGVHNRYGVHTVVLEVDGVEVFRSVVDRFASDENRYINSWTQSGYMKSFIDPGNRLRMLHAANGNRGLITIDEERAYHLVYTLSDALGNTSKVRFTLQGKKTDIPAVEHREKYTFRWNRTNYLQEPGLDLVVPKGMLYDDVFLDYAVRADSGDIAFTYQLTDVRVPLHSYCDLAIGLRRLPVADTTKYYVAAVTERGTRYSVGGNYENGFMRTRIRELGTYTVAIDTVPPVVTPVNPRQWGRTGRIVFKAKDKETGIRSYRGTIDGQYALFGKPNSISGNLVCELDPKHVKKGGRHRLELTVTDECGNRTTKIMNFEF
ncbi:MAG: M23 family metallopeptidase [Bacteroides sp.]|nr:M23 family metallopeptidase [Bacteroides sp.]